MYIIITLHDISDSILLLDALKIEYHLGTHDPLLLQHWTGPVVNDDKSLLKCKRKVYMYIGDPVQERKSSSVAGHGKQRKSKMRSILPSSNTNVIA